MNKASLLLVAFSSKIGLNFCNFWILTLTHLSTLAPEDHSLQKFDHMEQSWVHLWGQHTEMELNHLFYLSQALCQVHQLVQEKILETLIA